MSDSISTTDVEIVDINHDMNKKNMEIVIDGNDTDTDNDDDGNVAIQPIDMLVKENSKRIKEGGNDEKEIKSEAEEEEEIVAIFFTPACRNSPTHFVLFAFDVKS